MKNKVRIAYAKYCSVKYFLNDMYAASHTFICRNSILVFLILMRSSFFIISCTSDLLLSFLGNNMASL